MRSFATLADFAAAQGEHLGYSAWREVTQGQVDMFADATGDRQWIHVDPGRAAIGVRRAGVPHSGAGCEDLREKGACGRE